MDKGMLDRRVRWRQVIVAAAACLAMGTLGVMNQSSASGSKASPQGETLQKKETESSWVRSFPLWMGIPRKSFVKLGEGVVHRRRWGAYVYRGYGREPGRTPCVEVGALYFGSGRGGSFQHGSECGPLAPPAEQPVLNESGFSTKSGSHGRTSSDTVIALAVGGAVVDVRLLLRGGQEIQRRTLLLSAKQASKANVTQFGYVVFAVSRKACVVSTTGYDAAGSVLFRSSPRSCS